MNLPPKSNAVLTVLAAFRPAASLESNPGVPRSAYVNSNGIKDVRLLLPALEENPTQHIRSNRTRRETCKKSYQKPIPPIPTKLLKSSRQTDAWSCRGKWGSPKNSRALLQQNVSSEKTLDLVPSTATHPEDTGTWSIWLGVNGQLDSRIKRT